MQALVVYGSSHGGTEALAGMVADALERRHIHSDLRPAWPPADVPGFDLVIVGGALRGGRWHRAASRFVRSRRRELSEVPVYFFTTARLDRSCRLPDPTIPTAVSGLMDSVDAAGHAFFGECLNRPAVHRGSIVRRATDLSSPEVVDAWIDRVCADLSLDSRRN